MSTTRDGYCSVKKYVRFGDDRGLELFPADELWVTAYIIDVVSSIKISSLKVYLAAIQFTQVLEGHPYALALTGSELVR